jgi:hypothetical protein
MLSGRPSKPHLCNFLRDRDGDHGDRGNAAVLPALAAAAVRAVGGDGRPAASANKPAAWSVLSTDAGHATAAPLVRARRMRHRGDVGQWDRRAPRRIGSPIATARSVALAPRH